MRSFKKENFSRSEKILRDEFFYRLNNIKPEIKTAIWFFLTLYIFVIFYRNRNKQHEKINNELQKLNKKMCLIREELKEIKNKIM